jgi:CRP-like cAMP-binding protein
VRSGRVKLYRTSSSGREQTLETLEAGETCACNPGSPNWNCSSTAEAAAPTTVWFLSRNDYMRLLRENPRMSKALNHLFAERLRNFSCLIEEVSLKDVKQRLVKFLLDMLQEGNSQTSGAKDLFLPFTREEIAQRIGSARETVARYLTQLKESGLIDIKPKHIMILDQKRLEALLH